MDKVRAHIGSAPAPPKDTHKKTNQNKKNAVLIPQLDGRRRPLCESRGTQRTNGLKPGLGFGDPRLTEPDHTSHWQAGRALRDAWTVQWLETLCYKNSKRSLRSRVKIEDEWIFNGQPCWGFAINALLGHMIYLKKWVPRCSPALPHIYLISFIQIHVRTRLWSASCNINNYTVCGLVCL